MILQTMIAEAKKQGLGVSEIARRIGVDKSSVSRWFSGINEPKISEVEKLAKAVGLNLSITAMGEWKPVEKGRWVYAQCKCGKVADVPSPFCPECGKPMSRQKFDEYFGGGE